MAIKKDEEMSFRTTDDIFIQKIKSIEKDMDDFSP